MRNKQTINTKHADNPASKKHLGLRAFSLGFLAVFVLTIVFGLLISGSSVALFSASSNTITMQFEAGAGHSPSLQELLNMLINEVKSEGILVDANSNYGKNHKSWDIMLENFLTQRSPTNPTDEFKNPYSNKTLIVNQDTWPIEGSENPAVFLTDNGNHINFSSGAPQSLWGTIIVYSLGSGNSYEINHLFVDESGNVSSVERIFLRDYK